jgi:hypothetical protein
MPRYGQTQHASEVTSVLLRQRTTLESRSKYLFQDRFYLSSIDRNGLCKTIEKKSFDKPQHLIRQL